MKVSIVVPCFNEQDNINAFYQATVDAFNHLDYDYEFVFVDDGSKDLTMSRLNTLYNNDSKHINVISFSRNFGKESALYAGLKNTTGDYVSIIDADLQQRPELIIEMLDILKNNDNDYDVVAAYQQQRHENFIIKWFKRIFYKLINKISEVEFYPGASDFRTMKRQVVEAILSLEEYNRFSKGIFSWVGFNTYYMPYEVEERHSGSSKWSFFLLVRYALDGIIAFSVSPLKLSTYLGSILCGASLIYMMIVVIQKLFFGISIPGYHTLISVILLLGGIQLLILAIIGEYLAHTYTEEKNRPIYIERGHLKANVNENKNIPENK